MTERRQNGYVSQSNGHKGHGGHAMLNHYNGGNGQYVPRNMPLSPQNGENNMQELVSGMTGMNLHAAYGNSSTNKSGASLMSNATSEYGVPGQGLWVPANQHVMSPVYQVMGGGNHQQGAQAMYGHTNAFVPPAAYPYNQALVQAGPMGTGWSNRVSTGDVPSLMTPRRDSMSSNENDVPGTPYTGNGIYRYGTTAAIMDRSPGAAFTSSATPSPSQLAHQYQLVGQVKQQQVVPSIPAHILALLNKEPVIPRAIPAPSSPLKPLDRSLENKTGETNVYIRGLLPETQDEMLHAWGKRFGDIQSSKSIIDHKTNLCKGFGFIKYHNFEDAENCIRGFHYLGYEVSFARESFYAKLKKFSDDDNTNLYVSNIPKNMNEHELGAIFAPHKVCSSRILRDAAGNGRGVGFARFDTRDICEEIIRDYNNTPVCKPGGEEHLIQIRYSDTSEQKMLKQQTAAGRVFRAAEYEVGVAQARALTAPDRFMNINDQHGGSNEFELYLQGNTVAPFHHHRNFRQPWAPAIPSTLGMARSSMPHLTHGGYSSGIKADNGVKAEQDAALHHEVDNRATPATPVKIEGTTTSPGRLSGRED
ncbi:hypothetical protein B0J11DRAFT_482768 [Dendryphion nanum]|uniref:RRM domain-containing protein n=1 Tax=Dendryphion nanum TaxID=256645 RepID=A0A9P9E154_9PLEO|nr:hypothetical protein B0J11DRAFT_482768 [Dendryphion nanum]